MTVAMNISVTVKGGLFRQAARAVVEQQVLTEVLSKVEERTARGGRGIGAQRNTIRHDHNGALELTVSSTRVWPRTRGTAWQRKNMSVIRAMAPRVARKAAQRIAEELGGA